jgi:hypothetical protein
VKLDVDTMPTLPDAPPAAGPERALGLAAFTAFVVLALAALLLVGVLAMAELLPEVALTIP